MQEHLADDTKNGRDQSGGARKRKLDDSISNVLKLMRGYVDLRGTAMPKEVSQTSRR